MGKLAKPGDPLCTPRGNVELPAKNPQKFEEDLSLSAPILRNMTINSRRNVKELPSNDPGTQTAINAILMYQLLGLTQNETANILRIDLNTIQNIMLGSEYQMTFEMIFNEVINANSNSLQATLGRHAHSAIAQLVHLHKNAESEMVQLKASQDIADRAGLSSDTLYGKNSSSEEDTLKIVITDANDEEKTKISIDLNRKR
jgi:LPS O-antigen subunit length determinant protein (WzzB/FepE family)